VTERSQGRVLVVDADYNTLGTLARALRARGHHVTLCTDGRTGLQRAVESAPDVVLVDRDVSVVDAQTFLEVLRDNPRTTSAHAFVLSATEPGASSEAGRSEVLIKPFHVAEVVARIEAVMRLQKAPRREPELRGDLEQVALFDLLQVFSVNRRTGTLRVETLGASGEIAVRDGRIVDCVFRGVRGEKALYRLLASRRGQFVFFPGHLSGQTSIEASTDMLMMEAVRQADELSELSATMPSLGAQIALARRPSSEVSALAMRMLEHLGDETRSVDELCDAFPESDLDIMKGLKELLETNTLVVLDGGREPTKLCEEDEIVVLRAAALRLRAPGQEVPGRLAVIAGEDQALNRFVRALSAIDGFVGEAARPESLGPGSLGTIGTLRVGGVEIELFAVPADAQFRPLWGAFLAHARAAVWLRGEIDMEARELLRSLRIDVVLASEGFEHPQGAAQTLRASLTSSNLPRLSSRL
jgi:DNA-binding response OmpR family regulator